MRIGVVGGLASKTLRQPWPEGYDILPLGGYRDENIRTTRRLDLIVVMTKWAGHAYIAAIQALHAGRVRIIKWPSGFSSLIRDLPALAPLPPAAAVVREVEVATFIPSCDLHSGVEALPVSNENAPTPKIATQAENVLVALGLDRERTWTTKDIHELMGGPYASVRARVSELIERGALVVVNAGERHTKSNPRRLRLSSERPKQKTYETTFLLTPRSRWRRLLFMNNYLRRTPPLQGAVPPGPRAGRHHRDRGHPRPGRNAVGPQGRRSHRHPPHPPARWRG